MTDFAFETDVPVRYRDIDDMGHVNNAVYVTYLEEARTDYFRAVLGERVREVDSVVANHTLDYRRSITLEDDVTVAVGIDDLGETSLTLSQEVRADGEVAATAETTLVVLDSETREPMPIPEDVREAFVEFEGLEPATA